MSVQRTISLPDEVDAQLNELLAQFPFKVAASVVIAKAITEFYQKEKGQENGQA